MNDSFDRECKNGNNNSLILLFAVVGIDHKRRQIYT